MLSIWLLEYKNITRHLLKHINCKNLYNNIIGRTDKETTNFNGMTSHLASQYIVIDMQTVAPHKLCGEQAAPPQDTFALQTA